MSTEREAPNVEPMVQLRRHASWIADELMRCHPRRDTQSENSIEQEAAFVLRRLVEASRGLPAAPPEEKDETAWLVEGHGNGLALWWTGKWWPRFATIVHGPLHSSRAIVRSTDDMEPIFSPEHMEAIRFARKEDAERAIGLLPAFYRVAVKASEHMWVARTALGEGSGT